jgi:hypothetical protein
MAPYGESLWRKITGKPYSGKPNVRFDEGELEIELLATTPALYSTAVRTNRRIIRSPLLGPSAVKISSGIKNREKGAQESVNRKISYRTPDRLLNYGANSTVIVNLNFRGLL